MPDLPVIEMSRDLPGFPGYRRFALVQLDDDGLLCELRSLEDAALRFLVVPPQPFFPDYAPEVDDLTARELGVAAAGDVIVLLVLNAGASLAETTANLQAPVVVNTANRRAIQVILGDPDLPIAAPLVA